MRNITKIRKTFADLLPDLIHFGGVAIFAGAMGILIIVAMASGS